MPTKLEELQKEIDILKGRFAIREHIGIECAKALTRKQRRDLINRVHLLDSTTTPFSTSIINPFTIDMAAFNDGFEHEKARFLKWMSTDFPENT